MNVFLIDIYTSNTTIWTVSETEMNDKFSIRIRFDSARLPFDSIRFASQSKVS